MSREEKMDCREKQSCCKHDCCANDHVKKEDGHDMKNKKCNGFEREELGKLEEEIEKLKVENKGLRDNLLRSYADTDNLKKRFEKEKDEALKFSVSKFAKDLLSVLDNFDMAIKNTTEGTDVKTLIEGIKITEKELRSVLQRNGITQVEADKGKDFDHNIHQIMCEVSDESVGNGKIAETYQKGYLINGRLLRPALVGVSKLH